MVASTIQIGWVRTVSSLILVHALLAASWTSPNDTAQQLLVEARESIGGASKLSAIKSLIVSGGFTSVGTGRTPAFSSPGLGLNSQSVQTDDVGDVRLSFLLPDRFRQDYSYSLPGGVIGGIVITCRNGDDVWLANRLPDPMPSGMSVSMVSPPPPDAAKRRSVRFAHARYLLALLLYTDQSFPIDFTYAGKAEAPDGRADILDGHGLDGFTVRLFLDEKTHRPLMLGYPDPSTGKMTQLRMEEYRETAGIFLPHVISRSVEGRLREELRLEKYTINGKLDANEFRK